MGNGDVPVPVPVPVPFLTRLAFPRPRPLYPPHLFFFFPVNFSARIRTTLKERYQSWVIAFDVSSILQDPKLRIPMMYLLEGAYSM